MRILIIDDDGIFRKSMQHNLSRFGFVVEVATNSTTAQQLLRGSAFDGIVSDFMMPGINGLELLQSLRRGGYTRPIVMVSANTDPEMHNNALSAGATEFLSKPVNPAVLASALRGQSSQRKKSSPEVGPRLTKPD